MLAKFTDVRDISGTEKKLNIMCLDDCRCYDIDQGCQTHLNWLAGPSPQGFLQVRQHTAGSSLSSFLQRLPHLPSCRRFGCLMEIANWKFSGRANSGDSINPPSARLASTVASAAVRSPAGWIWWWVIWTMRSPIDWMTHL